MSVSLPNCMVCGGPVAVTPLGAQCPLCLFGVMAGGEPETPEGARAFGEYELLEELGRGGMGIVYRAWQPRLERFVALKMLLPGPFALPEFAERFRREVLAVARLNHPGIAAIHEAGEHDGQAFYTMELVEGRNLAERLRETLPSPREAAGIAEQAARALSHAHRAGVLHRDLKPSNILLTADGGPKLVDFGLAQLADSTSSTAALTTGLMGTPSYMAPEQAAGGTAVTATDVYALGAVLYEMLTGRPPHPGSSLAEILNYVREVPVVEPRRWIPAVPRDLETVCLKCLERDPARRYSSAEELAEDLRRFLAGEPVRAKPPGPAGKFLRWCRRRPAVAALSIVSVLALVTTAAVSVYANARTRQAAAEIRLSAIEARQRLRESLLAQAGAALHTQDGGRRFASLDALRQAQQFGGSADIRRLGLEALMLPDLRLRHQWTAEGGGLVTAAPDGLSWIILQRGAEGTAQIMVRRAADNGETARLSGLPAPGTDQRAVLSPDGGVTLYAGADGKLRAHRLRDGALLLETPAAGGGAFSADGSRLSVVDPAGWLRLLEVSTGQSVEGWQARRVGLPQYMAMPNVRLSPDGTLVAAASADLRSLLIMEATGGRLLRRIPLPDQPYYFAWHPRSRIIAVACEGSVLILDAVGGEVLSGWSTESSGAVLSLTFTSNGKILATAGWDRRVRLWDWKEPAVLVSAPGSGVAEVFSRDDRDLLVTSGASVMVWEIAEARGLRQVSRAVRWPKSPEPLQTVAFDPAGRWMAFLSGTEIEWWTADGSRLVGRIPCGPAHALTFHPKRGELIVSSTEGLAALPYREESGRLIAGPWRALWTERPAHLFSINPAGDRAAVWVPESQAGGGHRLVILETDETSWRVWAENGEAAGPPRGPRWSADGRWIADHNWHGGPFTVWDGSTAQIVRNDLPPQGAWTGAHWTPDGRVWAATDRGEWTGDPLAGTPPALQEAKNPADGELQTASFSPDGALLALGGARGDITLRRWPEDKPLLTCRLTEGHQSLPLTMTFSPDNRRVAITTSDLRLLLWDLEEAVSAATGAGLVCPPLPVSFSSAATARSDASKLAGAPSGTAAGAAPAGTGEGSLEILPAATRPPLGTALPPRAPDTPPQCLDLSAWLNAPLSEPLTDGLAGGFWQLSGLAAGPQRLGGVEFDVRGLIRLNGGGLLLRFPDLPAAVPGIAVGRKCARLHFLLGSCTDAATGVVIGRIAVNSASGVRRVVDLTSGSVVNGSLLPDGTFPILTAASREVWRTATPGVPGHYACIYQHTWVNPKPSLTVETLDFTSTLENGAPFLMAVTAED